MNVKTFAGKVLTVLMACALFGSVAHAEEWYIPKTIEVLPKGRVEAGVRLQLSGNEDGILDTQEVSLIPSARYSPTTQLEIYGEIPLSNKSQDQIVGFSVVENDKSGIGDLFLQATYEIAAKSNWKVSGSLDVTAPTGNDPYENTVGLGSGYWTTAPGVNFAYVSDPAVLFAYLGYQHGFSETFNVSGTSTKVDPGDSVRTRLGASFAFNPRLNMTMYTALDFRDDTKQNDVKVAESDDTLARLGLSFGFKLDKDMSIGMNTVFGLNDSTSDYVISLGMRYGF